MKREFLKGLNLEESVIDQIMSQNGVDIENTKKSFGDVDSIKQENESYKSQLAERDKDIKSLSKQVKDNDDLSSQLSDLQDKYKTDTTNLNNQLSQTKLNGALNETLAAAKVRNPKAVKGLLDMDRVKLTDDGKIEGIDDQLEALRKSDAYLFDEGTKSQYSPEGGSGSQDTDPAQTMIDAFKN